MLDGEWPMADVGCRMSDVRCQMSDVRSRKSEVMLNRQVLTAAKNLVFT